MTLDDVRAAYQIDEPDLRQRLGIDEAVPMNKPIRDFDQAERSSTPSPNEIETLLADGESSSYPVEGESAAPEYDPNQAATSTSIPESPRSSRDQEEATSGTDLIRGWMTLEQIRRMYGMEEAEFRRFIGLPASISLDTPVRDLELMEDEGLPSTEVIRKLFANRTPVAAPSESVGRSRATTSGGNRRSTQAIRPRSGGGRGRRQTSSSSLQSFRGSTTLQEALDSSGKTLEQVRKDWGQSFLDPQTNLGTLARTLGVPMWELRDYFEK
jgi:hypothetical protein